MDAVPATERRFIRQRVVPLEQQIDENKALPIDLVHAMREMGLFGSALPEENGGLGLSTTGEARLVFELGYTRPSLRSGVCTNNGIARHTLMAAGTPEQKRDWLRGIGVYERTRQIEQVVIAGQLLGVAA